MIDRKFIIISIILSLATILAFARLSFGQRPPNPGLEWFDRFDTNKNGNIEAEEFRAAADFFFKKIDRNGDGVIDDAERPKNPLPPKGGEPGQFPPNGGNEEFRPEPGRMPIPFFVMESIKEPGSVSRADFDERISRQFSEMDKNGDGTATREEARAKFEEVDRRVKNEQGPPGNPPPFDSPTAQFIGAELRFGDKLVKDAPFSAEIIVENTRRLYDGSTVTKQTKGAIYRDSLGRTRREQPLETIGGFSVVGDNNQPQKLVFINDFVSMTQYFLDLNRKVAQKNPIPENRPPLPELEPKEGKTESLGTKMLEGVKVEGTRTTFEIPAGQIGNDKPIQVVTEKWYSPELQMIVMSRHIDPLAGEHIFRLVNIKRSEPAAELFTVPGGFKIENPPPRNKRDD